MTLSIATVERRFTAFDVYLNDKKIDTTFHQGQTVEEQKRSLVAHDGYDSEIEVYGVADSVVPLTKKEMRTLLEDVEAETFLDVVKWRWGDATGASAPWGWIRRVQRIPTNKRYHKGVALIINPLYTTRIDHTR